MFTLATIMLLAQPAAPDWSDLTRQQRVAIQSHLDDIVRLPNDQLVDLWALAERSRVLHSSVRLKSNAARPPSWRDYVVDESRESRLWRITPSELGDTEGVPTLPQPPTASLAAAFDADGLIWVSSTPSPTTEYDCRWDQSHHVPKSAAYPPGWPWGRDFDPARFKIPLWREHATQHNIDTADPAFLAWCAGRAWCLQAFRDPADLLESATHVRADEFLLNGRSVLIPRSFRGPGYLWIENLYDPACVGVLVRDSDLRVTREQVVAAIASGKLSITAWRAADRNGTEAWEIDHVIDAATLRP